MLVIKIASDLNACGHENINACQGASQVCGDPASKIVARRVYIYIYESFLIEVNTEHMLSFIIFNMSEVLHTVYIYIHKKYIYIYTQSARLDSC